MLHSYSITQFKRMFFCYLCINCIEFSILAITKSIQCNYFQIITASADIVTKFSTRKNNDQTNIEHVKNKNGTKVYNFNTSNAENVLVQEDVDYTDSKEFDN